MARGGPKTAEGKAVVATNAIRHGALAAVPVLSGLEDPALWEAHRAGTLESLAPVGHLETVLAERAALLLWRLGRVTRYEGEAIALSQEQAAEETTETVYAGHWHLERVECNLAELRRREANCNANARRLRRFQSFQGGRKLDSLTAAEVIYAIEDAAFCGKERPEEIVYPGIPEDAEELEDVEDWTAGKVRACLQAISAHTGDSEEDLFAVAIDHEETEARRMAIAAERVQEDLDRKLRKRMLPDAATLEKVSRYETHLHRQFTSTLHELEALQARRKGQAAPLARVDVSGAGE